MPIEILNILTTINSNSTDHSAGIGANFIVVLKATALQVCFTILSVEGLEFIFN